MRMKLKAYLSIEGHTIERLAHVLARSRETIRRVRDNKSLTPIVVFDSETEKVDHLEINSVRKIMAVNNE